jgi:hypothetical protein
MLAAIVLREVPVSLLGFSGTEQVELMDQVGMEGYDIPHVICPVFARNLAGRFIYLDIGGLTSRVVKPVGLNNQVSKVGSDLVSFRFVQFGLLLRFVWVGHEFSLTCCWLARQRTKKNASPEGEAFVILIRKRRTYSGRLFFPLLYGTAGGSIPFISYQRR